MNCVTLSNSFKQFVVKKSKKTNLSGKFIHMYKDKNIFLVEIVRFDLVFDK